MKTDLSKEINRIANLKQNKDKDLSESALEQMAKVNLITREFKNNPLFPDPIDQELAVKKFKSYTQDYELVSLSDLDTLRSLIFVEIYERKVQMQINTILEEKKYPNERLTKQLTDLQNQKLNLKVKLGIDSEEGEKDELTGLQTLKKRFHKYIQANKNEFTLTVPFECKKCGHKDAQLHLLRRRIKDFEAMKHPWYAGRFFFNYEMLKDVKEGKLSKVDAWRYMCSCAKTEDEKIVTSEKYCTDYIEYCLKHWDEITKNL